MNAAWKSESVGFSVHVKFSGTSFIIFGHENLLLWLSLCSCLPPDWPEGQAPEKCSCFRHNFSPTEMTRPSHNLAWRGKGQRENWWGNSSHLQSAQVLRLKLVLNISKHCWSLSHTAYEENLFSKVSKITQTTGKSACVYPLLIGPLWNCAQPFCLSSITSHFSAVASCNWIASSGCFVLNLPYFQNLVIFFELCLLPMSVSAPATPAERQSAARYLCGWN